MTVFKEKFFLSSFLLNFFMWCLLTLSIFLSMPINFFKKLLPRKRCVPIQDEILLYTATQLAQKIRKRDLTSETVIMAYIKRIESVNPTLNAVMDECFSTAIRQARSVDKLIESQKYTEEYLTEHKPLFGVPVTVKESIAVKGLTHNAGSLKASYNRPRATEDAASVQLIREAGGIVLAVTATPELCMNWETFNGIIGTTCNPYNVRKTPGGSSGGEASLISSAASLMGIGSDLAGSLRVPAHFTGIFAHKPTPGIVSIRGHFPQCSDPNFYKYLQIGPLTRYAEDLPLLLQAILKPDVRRKINLNATVQMENMQIFYMLNNTGNMLTSRVSKCIEKAIVKAGNYFQNVYGIQPVEANIKLFKHSVKFGNFPLINLQGIDTVWSGKDEGPWKELFKYLTCRSPVSIFTIGVGIEMKTLQGTKLIAQKCEESDEIIRAIQEEFKTLLGNNGVLIYPTLPFTALHHNQFSNYMHDGTYCSIFNILGFPVTNCPMGMDSEGMPLGFQIVANPFNDRLTLAVAKELEKAFGGWQAPPSSDKEPIMLQREITRL